MIRVNIAPVYVKIGGYKIMRIIKKVGFGRQMPWYVGGGYGVAVCGCNTVAGNKKTAGRYLRLFPLS